MTNRLIVRCTLVALALGLVLDSAPLAQTWVPEKRILFLSTTYQRVAVERHLFSGPVTPGGDRSLDLGDIDSNSVLLSSDYGLTDRLAIAGDVALISSRYHGNVPENPGIDDGAYHGSFQNLGVQLRYRLGRSALGVTPFVGVSVPTHNYENLGHAAIGANLYSYQAGTYVGYVWNLSLHTTYVQGRISQEFFERHEEHRLRRNQVSLEAGTFLNRFLGVRGFGTWQRSRGGLDWVDDLHTMDDLHAHDALANSNYYNVGAGIMLRIGDSNVFTVSYAGIVSGENSHDAQGIIVGTTWSPGTGARRRESARSRRIQGNTQQPKGSQT